MAELAILFSNFWKIGAANKKRNKLSAAKESRKKHSAAKNKKQKKLSATKKNATSGRQNIKVLEMAATVCI